MARVFEVSTDQTWIDLIVTAAAALPHGNRCNQSAVQAGDLERTYPSADQLAAYMAQGTDQVIICHDKAALDGYLVVREDTEGGYGCYGKWVGVFPRNPQSLVAAIYRGMFDVAIGFYPPIIRGRITNPELLEWLRVTIPGSVHPSDPQIIIYGE